MALQTVRSPTGPSSPVAKGGSARGAFFSADRLAYARPAAVDMFAAEEPPWAEPGHWL